MNIANVAEFKRLKRIITCLAACSLVVFALIYQAACSKPISLASPFEIQLRTRTFTPEPGIPADLGARIERVITRMPIELAPDKRRAHLIVQLENPPETADRERLAKQGLTLLEPLNKRVWYAAVTSAGAKALVGLERVRWADLIKPEDKLAKVLHDDLPPLPYHLRPGDRIAYSILFHKDVKADEVLGFANRIDINLEDFDAQAFPVVRAVTVNVPRGGLTTLTEADKIGRAHV